MYNCLHSCGKRSGVCRGFAVGRFGFYRSDMTMISVQARPAAPADAERLALLHNSTSEPHFHTRADRLAKAIQGDPGGYLVAESAGLVVGYVSLWHPDFHPTHTWLGLHLHPDHRADGTAQALLEAARGHGRPRLWTSVRADYLPAGPDLAGLGFREVHRTFGGGFHLDRWAADLARLERDLAAQGVTIRPHADLTVEQRDRLPHLYAEVRTDKVTAEPTIPPANPELHDPDQLWEAAFVALSDGVPIGLAVPERAGLGAWNAVLLVRPERRRLGIGTALQARVCAALHAQGFDFLNTAGVGSDAAYLGVLRRLGANIEPDWIAYERMA